MRWLKIKANGSWYEPTICPTDRTYCYVDYDCRAGIAAESIYDRFGCYNPPNLPTVWVNCRATWPLQ
jgi:hypothetical protein